MLEIKLPLSWASTFGSALLLLSSATTASADTAVSLGGFLSASSPTSFTIADLQTYASQHASAVKSVTVGSDTYTGVSLFSYLNSVVATDPKVPKNDILRDYVVASGSGGSSFTYALGSLSGSGFGNLNDIIAYSDSNGALSNASIIAADGANITNLSSLNIGHVDYSGAGAGGQNTSFVVNGLVSNPTVYSAANLPNTLGTDNVTIGTNTYNGVSLWNLLLQAGLSTDPATLANEYVIATGTDNYQAILSLEELNPLYGNLNDILAYGLGGGSLGTNGFARIVLPGDTKAGRFVSNLESLTVVSSVPLPTSALLMLSGLLGMGFRSLAKNLKSRLTV
ncbi:hypothetical protein [Methylomonas sp. AM2-LC]|uniref:hypothetical protein n=1 Tax=Methylomonas sp. AM2-LC TaxID=3153301 RepID=UPI003266B21A